MTGKMPVPLREKKLPPVDGGDRRATSVYDGSGTLNPPIVRSVRNTRPYLYYYLRNSCRAAKISSEIGS